LEGCISPAYIRPIAETLLHVFRPLTSDRQYLSYDVFLEVRGEIIRTVLCGIVVFTASVSVPSGICSLL